MVFLVVLVVLAVVFGIGAVIKGFLWLLLIAAALGVAAFFAGRHWVRNRI